MDARENEGEPHVHLIGPTTSHPKGRVTLSS